MIADIACAERGCACHDPRVDGEGIEMIPKTELQQERERCAQLVENLIKRNQDSPLIVPKLKVLLEKIRKPKSTGRRGGRSPEQLELPFNN